MSPSPSVTVQQIQDLVMGNRAIRAPGYESFLRGSSLEPEPPVGIKNQPGRCLHVHEADTLDEEQVATWVRQAAAIPGEFS